MFVLDETSLRDEWGIVIWIGWDPGVPESQRFVREECAGQMIASGMAVLFGNTETV